MIMYIGTMYNAIVVGTGGHVRKLKMRAYYKLQITDFVFGALIRALKL
jgi:hypothetical protein